MNCNFFKACGKLSFTTPILNFYDLNFKLLCKIMKIELLFDLCKVNEEVIITSIQFYYL